MKEVATDRELGFVLGNAIDLSVLTLLGNEIKKQYFDK
jgi:hypothetical protein